MTRHRHVAPALLAALCLLLARPAAAQISFTVAFEDPTNAYAGYYDRLTSHVLAAGDLWADQLVSTAPVSLDVLVKFPTNTPRASGRSFTAAFVGNIGGINTFEQGAAHEVRTGIDPNGADADIEFNFNPSYLANELWFDPDPTARTAAVATDRVDALSVVLHEFGHAFSFNGWRDGTTGALPGDYQSTFDIHVSSSGGNLFFNGANARSIYGAPVPVTYGNNFHIGNASPRPGANLIPDLMNGVVFFTGQRYDISLLDLAITQDAGLQTLAFVVPEPGVGALLWGGLCVFVAGVVRRCGSA